MIQSFVLAGLGDKLVFCDTLIRTAVVRRRLDYLLYIFSDSCLFISWILSSFSLKRPFLSLRKFALGLIC